MLKYLALVLCFLRISAGLPQELPYKSWAGKRVMFIYAHPDDMEVSAGGLVSLLTPQTEVSLVIVTNGDKGCSNSLCTNMTDAQLAAERQQEQMQAAAVLGIKWSHVVMLDYGDAMLTSYAEQQVRQDLVYYVRSIKPNVVMTWFPYPNFNLLPSQGWDDMGYHPDHQASGKLTLDAVFDAGVNRLFPQSGPAWHVSEFYMWEFLTPTYYVDITGTPYQAKVNAYLEHHSQYSDPAQVTQIMSFLGTSVANVSGLTSGRMAEGFTMYS